MSSGSTCEMKIFAYSRREKEHTPLLRQYLRIFTDASVLRGSEIKPPETSAGLVLQVALPSSPR